MNGVLGIIVAAGRGTRLRPFTDQAPKCLHPFAGRRLIDWQLDALRANGITRIGMVRGYRKEMLAEFGLETWDNPRWEETNMVHSLLRAREALLAAETVVVAYADIVYEPRLVAALLAAPDDIATTVDLDWLSLWRLRFADPLSDAESLKMDTAHAILDIGRKVKSLDEIEAQYMGLLKFSAKGMRAFVNYCDARGGAVDRLAMTDVLAGLIGQGMPVRGVPIRGGWLEFDGTSDVAAYAKLGPTGGLSLGRAAVSA